MKIGLVSTELGISASTIRYYERIGLTAPPPRVAGRREYDHKLVLELKFIRLAQLAGFSIKEIRAMSSSEDTESGSNPWQPFADEKLVAVRKKIKSLQNMERMLSTLKGCDCGSLALCAETESATSMLCCSLNTRLK